MSIQTEETDEAICRICLGNSNLMISPCMCKGSISYLHESCLKMWICYRYYNISIADCEICKQRLKMQFKVRKKFDPFNGIRDKIPIYILLFIGIIFIFVMVLSVFEFAKIIINSDDWLVRLTKFQYIVVFSGIAVLTVVKFWEVFKKECTHIELLEWIFLPNVDESVSLNLTSGP